ncbi:MAG: FhaA domain-containing protein [Chloroflexota bacterium]
MPTLAEFESRLQSLLEVNLPKYLPGYKAEDGIVQQLAVAMHGHLKEIGEATQAPNLYVVVAHSSTMTRWHAEPRLLKELANALYTAGKEAGFQFQSNPVVTTFANKSLSANEVHIVASFTNEDLAETHAAPSIANPEPGDGSVSNNAFFIIGGAKVYPLDHSVVNIGRRLENHIVIDDPRVSRAHAQLRTVKDRFILFDLSSSGGTFVNGERINQATLSAGDIVSLAGVTLIFGQDFSPESTPDEEKTGPGSSSDDDQHPENIQKGDKVR